MPNGMEDRRGRSRQGNNTSVSKEIDKIKKAELNLTQSPAESGDGVALITVTGASSLDRNISRAREKRTALLQHPHMLSLAPIL